MELQFHGANCVTIATKNARVVIDDNLADIGAKSITKSGDVVLFTGVHADPGQTPKLAIDHAGEYEVAGISIVGVPARAHIDQAGEKTATMYKLTVDDMRVLVVGHIYPSLTEGQLEAIGMIDIMVVPVGGNGYTLDPTGAMTIVKKVEPKLVIPTHYDDSSLHFPVPQASLQDALKGLTMEVKETLAKFKPKAVDLGEGTHIVVIQQS